ncbi:MAG: GNAT family N-acetyltransferase [Pseudomonadota bacterium]
MDFVDLRHAGADLRAAALALNAEHEVETAPLDAGGLSALLTACVIAPAHPDGRAFLLGLGPGQPYDSVNYRWVAERYADFIYVDRVIVGHDLRGRGVGRALYGAAFAHERRHGVPVVCEVNWVPPNPGSDAFHAALGFAEVGRGAPGPGKEVRYLAWTP